MGWEEQKLSTTWQHSINNVGEYSTNSNVRQPQRHENMSKGNLSYVPSFENTRWIVARSSLFTVLSHSALLSCLSLSSSYVVLISFHLHPLVSTTSLSFMFTALTFIPFICFTFSHFSSFEFIYGV